MMIINTIFTNPVDLPPRSCYESAKAIQFPHPGLKIIQLIIEQS